MRLPASLPDGDLEPMSAANLMATIQGLCNESELKRIEIIGALECVKACLIASWQVDMGSD